MRHGVWSSAVQLHLEMDSVLYFTDKNIFPRWGVIISGPTRSSSVQATSRHKFTRIL